MLICHWLVALLPLFHSVGRKLIENQSWYTGRELNGALPPHLVFINYFSLYLCFLAMLGEVFVHISCLSNWVCRLNILEFPNLGRKALCSRFLLSGWSCIGFSVGRWGLYFRGSHVNPLVVSNWERTAWNKCCCNHFCFFQKHL